MNIIWSHFAFGWPNIFFEPSVKWFIICIPPKECHGNMGMPVNKSGSHK